MELSESRYEEIKEAVKEHLKEHEKRYIHVLGVVEMAEYLAKRYNVDVLKAKVAAILHDYAKYEDKCLDLLSDEDKLECNKYPFLAHGMLSAKIARDVFNIDDEDIYNSIRNHTVGRKGMSMLEKIIFIADFTEKNRTYDDCIKCRDVLINKGIDDAIIYSIKKTIEHTKEEGYMPHPNQLEILKEYEENKNA